MRGLLPEQRTDVTGRTQTRWIRAASGTPGKSAIPPLPALQSPTSELADAAHALVLAGWKPQGLTPDHLRVRMRVIADAAPATLDRALTQWTSDDLLGRLWGRAFRSALQPATPERFADRLPEELRDWQTSAVVYPVALDLLTQAYDGTHRTPRAVTNVRGWVRRVQRAGAAEFGEAGLEALTVLSILDAVPEEAPRRGVLYVERSEASLRRVGVLARTLAGRVEDLKRIMPELLGRGAGADEGLIRRLLETDGATPVLLDGAL